MNIEPVEHWVVTHHKAHETTAKTYYTDPLDKQALLSELLSKMPESKYMVPDGNGVENNRRYGYNQALSEVEQVLRESLGSDE